MDWDDFRSRCAWAAELEQYGYVGTMIGHDRVATYIGTFGQYITECSIGLNARTGINIDEANANHRYFVELVTHGVIVQADDPYAGLGIRLHDGRIIVPLTAIPAKLRLLYRLRHRAVTDS